MKTLSVKKLWNTMLAMGRPALFGILGIAIALGLMGWRLTTLTPGLSQTEINTYNSTRSPSDMLDDSINAPYRVAVFAITKVANNTFGLRIVGALLGVLAIIIFYLLSTRLYKPIIAIAISLMFATSTLLLSVSRSASTNVMLLSLLAIIGVGYMVRFDKRQEIAWILTSIVIGLTLYVPGMAVLLVAAAIWQFRRIRRSFESLEPVIIIICSVIVSLLATPLVISLIRNPDLWRELLGMPSALGSFAEMGNSVFRAILSIFVAAPHNPEYWLGRQPILGVFGSVMFLFGWFALARNRKLDRLWTLAGIFVVILLWIGITTNLMYLVALLPFIYIVIGFGLQELLRQWQSVFPRNPIARGVGLGLVLVAVVLSVNFQMQRYFVAWPHNSETKQAYRFELPK